MNKSKTHDIGRIKDNNTKIEAPYKRQKTPTTHSIINTKRLGHQDKKKNIHKNKLNPHMTHKIHTAQMTSNKTHKNLQAYLESLHRRIFYPSIFNIKPISSSSIF
jgi:hypothetical protein